MKQPINGSWLPVVGYEDYYEVSDQGDVRSRDRVVHVRGRSSYTKLGGLLTPSTGSVGHKFVRLSHDGVKTAHYVHRLVAEAFIGPSEGRNVLHWNDDPSDNRVENLRYGDQSANGHDAVRNGRNYYSNKTHCVRGHEFTPENTRVEYPPSRGGREVRRCRACARERRRHERRLP